MKRQRTLVSRMLVIMVVMLMALSTSVVTNALIITGTADEIVLSKTATETTDGSVKDEHGNAKQTYDINLSVSGKRVYPGAPVDIVLAIDLSNSMTSNSSKNLEVTKSAAVSFINAVLADKDTAARIAVVTYGTYARAYNFANTSKKYSDKWDLYGSTKSTDVYYTKDKAKALEVLNNAEFQPATLKPTGKGSDYTTYESGGTNTEVGFKVTQAVTTTRNRPDAASFVVFMTDGIPTYRSNGTGVSGTGSSTDARDFNNAVAAAMSLKQAGNDIYTVGLLTSYTTGSYQMQMANKLLSDEASYTATGSGSAWTYTKIGGAYATKYYPVYSATDASVNLNEIYTTLTQKSFALASGTVTDTVPTAFAILDENKADLIDMGHSVVENADGTTTIAFRDVLASEVKSDLPTIKVQYKGNGYGTVYTNTNATYVGKLYDATPFSKEFNKPVAGLKPATVDDTAATEVSKSITIDATSNDLFVNNRVSVAGNSVSDYRLLLTDANGNEIAYTNAQNGFDASVADGKIIFVSSNDATKTFYYIIKATVTPNSSYAAKNSTVLISRPTQVTVTVTKKETPEEPKPPEEAPDNSLDLSGVSYAYIFGYEPGYKVVTDEDGKKVEVVDIKMAMDDSVTREQVAAMLMRMIDQTFDTQNVQYQITDNIKEHKGTWYERGLAYMSSKGAFDGIEQVYTGPVSRGEVAKLVVYGLNLSKTTNTNFTDIDNSPYASYIKTMVAYGYMQGTSSTTFDPDLIMTRAQFCTLFNNIIGRDEMGLTALDENGNEYEISAETYNFSDMNPNHWAYKICLKATSAYDKDGYVDVETRNTNIRNRLDQYNAQTKY